MKRFVPAFAFSLATVTPLAMPAFGADLPQPAQAAPTMPAFVDAAAWTGFYIGANVGYAHGVTKFPGAGNALTNRSDALIGGVQAGHDWQAGMFVLGLVGDFQATDLSKTYREPDGSLTTRLDRIGTVRARIGIPFDGIMPYLTGGFAYGRNIVRAREDDVSVHISKDHFGWTAGAGVEAQLGHGWSLQAEYLYADFGRRMYNQVVVSATDTTEFSLPARPTAHIARIGVNYRF
ncbi:MAG: porin family protein [Salinarimonas sp.]|nr:porin family protein [Salinarimonas sp.]